MKIVTLASALMASALLSAVVFAAPGSKPRPSTTGLSTPYVFDASGFAVGPVSSEYDNVALRNFKQFLFSTDYGVFGIRLDNLQVGNSGLYVPTSNIGYSAWDCPAGYEFIVNNTSVRRIYDLNGGDYFAVVPNEGNKDKPQKVLLGLESSLGQKFAYSTRTDSGDCVNSPLYPNNPVPMSGYDVVARIPLNPSANITYPLKISY